MQIRLPQDLVVHTSRVDELAVAYGQLYAPPQIVVHDPASLDAFGSQRVLGRVRVGYGGFGAATDIKFPHADCFLYLLPVNGSGHLSTRSRTYEVASGRPLVVSPDAGHSASYSATFQTFTIKFERSLLNGALESMTGKTLTAPLIFEPQSRRDAWSSPLQIYFQQLVDTLEQTRPEALPEWWLAQTEHMLAMLLLSEERHSYSYLFDEPAADTSRQQVRRAEEFIEANRDRAVSVDDLASACDVSVLSLYRAFKRVRGCSPVQFASRLRGSGRRLADGPA